MIVIVFFYLMITIVNSSQSQQFVCPSGWVNAKENCWIFRQDPLSWAEARLECLKLGGDLASIVTDEDNHRLYHIRNSVLATIRQANRRKLGNSNTSIKVEYIE